MDVEKPRRSDLALVAMGLVLVVLLFDLAALPSRGGTLGPAESDQGRGVFLPHVVRRDLRGPTDRPPVTTVPTASPSTTPLATPTATPSPTPSATSPVDDRELVLQIATYGGLHSDSMFGAEFIRQSPWYAAWAPRETGGTGLALVMPHVAGDADPTELWMVEIDGAELQEIVRRLTDEVGFFDLRPPDESGECVTDLDETAIRLRLPQPGGRDRWLAVYGLDWYLRGEAPCRPRDGTPTPPDARIVALARIVKELREPIGDGRPYPLRAASLVVMRVREMPNAAPWPLDHDLLAIAPEPWQPSFEEIRGADVAAAMQVVRAGRSPGWVMAPFTHGGEPFVVGVRPEPPRWLESMPRPGATRVNCPPIPPVCTAGPPPTACTGPSCPTPDPCPCDP